MVQKRQAVFDISHVRKIIKEEIPASMGSDSDGNAAVPDEFDVIAMDKLADGEDEVVITDVDGVEPLAPVEEPVITHKQIVEIEEITIVPVKVDPIEIPSIRDTQGRLSDLVDDLMDSMQLSVIPMTAIGVRSQVSELKRHTIREFDGVKLAMNKDSVRDNVLAEYKDRIIEALQEGVPFKESLWCDFKGNGATCRTLKLSELEWSYLYKYFELYNLKIKAQKDPVTQRTDVIMYLE